MNELKNIASHEVIKEKTQYKGTTLATYVFEFIGFIAVIVLAWFLGNDTHGRCLNFLAALLGASLGWAFAVMSSPYSEVNGAKFTNLGRTISLFGSGYLIGKLDKVIEAAFKPEVILEGTALTRVLLFLTGLLVIGMATLSSRLYINEIKRVEAKILEPVMDDAEKPKA